MSIEMIIDSHSIARDWSEKDRATLRDQIRQGVASIEDLGDGLLKITAETPTETNSQTSAVTTVSHLKKIPAHVKALSRGIATTGKGLVETSVSTIKLADEAAIGLGAFAIMTVGTVVFSPAIAIFDRQRNVADVASEYKRIANNPKLARLVGYTAIAASATLALELKKS